MVQVTLPIIHWALLIKFEGNYGQLGNGSDAHCAVPTIVKFFIDSNIKITQIACGEKNTAFLTDKGNYFFIIYYYLLFIIFYYFYYLHIYL